MSVLSSVLTTFHSSPTQPRTSSCRHLPSFLSNDRASLGNAFISTYRTLIAYSFQIRYQQQLGGHMVMMLYIRSLTLYFMTSFILSFPHDIYIILIFSLSFSWHHPRIIFILFHNSYSSSNCSSSCHRKFQFHAVQSVGIQLGAFMLASVAFLWDVFDKNTRTSILRRTSRIFLVTKDFMHD
jgi:hypothetical protein